MSTTHLRHRHHSRRQLRTAFEPGRSRWMPDGKSIAFVGPDERGVSGIYVQQFSPGRDTSSSRRQLAGFDPDAQAESFGVSPDGKAITIAGLQQLLSVMIPENVEGVERPAR